MTNQEAPPTIPNPPVNPGNAPEPPPPDNPAPPPESSYFARLLAYIPAELVMAYTAVDGIMKEAILDNPAWLHWTVAGSLLLLTPLYVIFRPVPPALLNHSKRFNAIAAVIAMATWIFALGGPFLVTWPDVYRPVYGSLLLIVVTLTIPVLEEIAVRVNFFR